MCGKKERLGSCPWTSAHEHVTGALDVGTSLDHCKRGSVPSELSPNPQIFCHVELPWASRMEPATTRKNRHERALPSL